MIEIPPVSSSYPVKKLTKIIREQKQSSDRQQSEQQHQEDERDQSNELPDQHIDEIV
jgi:hypothetical protein